MNKTFKIGLVYINTNNIGDIVIFDTTKYLIKKSLKTLGIDNYKIIPIDMGEKIAGTSDLPASFTKKQQNKYADSNKYIKEWKSSKLYHYFAKNELPKIQPLDMIVFAGGGLIKFHQQYFHMYIDEVTTVADKYNIPVIFNAVGVEGYRENDTRCQILKTALNRKCVKAISTRDSINLLNEKYLIRKNIYSTQVCDPALWTKEAYQISQEPQSVIGLGVIRPEIFSLYGVSAPKEKLLNFYKMIILDLESKNKKYKLFTNGARRDHKFIDEIRIYMGRGDDFKENIEPIPKSGKALARMISKYDRLMTCRMHAAVIAYSLSIPSVTVVWNKKLEYFAQATGQPENLLYSKDFDNKEKVMSKIIDNRIPVVDSAYKNTDYEFLRDSFKKYYRRRYLTKAYRFALAKKNELFARIASM